MGHRFDDERPSRREFLPGMSAATVAALVNVGEPRFARGEEPIQQPRPTADTLHRALDGRWHGGPETFDPKRYTPFEVGVPFEKILCTFPSIDTAVDNIKISQDCEEIAKVMDRATLIRGHVVADLGNILHSRHQYHWHTGYVPPDRRLLAHRRLDGRRCWGRRTRRSRRS